MEEKSSTKKTTEQAENIGQKSPAALREEKILAFWQGNKIFEKTLAKESPKGEFVFYEGPPTANAKPGIHHLEARAFKDAIPRYKTMRGYHVRRKSGWDTHGLPVELQVEKELGLKSKKEIEQYGIAEFNKKCKESVWRHIDLWEEFTDRIGYWVDQKNPYITYKPDYIESLWAITKKVSDQGLLYKDYKVVPWCPRCGTALSSHELAQGYENDKDLSVYVKFKIESQPSTFLLAWTTTPWTLPGNVALAVGEKVKYSVVQASNGTYILASDLIGKVFTGETVKVVKEMLGSELVGLEYQPPYPYLSEKFKDKDKKAFENAYKIYAADFVNTNDGTGIVHTAVMYGQDDFELGVKVGLPKHHLVNEDGTFKDGTNFLTGKFVRDEETTVAIIKDLADRGSLFKKEKFEHSYPHCWRCNTPLIYFARDSWYIKMSALKDKLVKENETIHWEPKHIKEGRFGEWLLEVKDWAISRERYWGTPLPVWICEKCKHTHVLGSLGEIKEKTSRNNRYTLIRHGEAEHNVKNILSSNPDYPHHLTGKGEESARRAVVSLRDKKIDLIFSSPFIRTKETAGIIAKELNLPKDRVIYDNRIGEINFGDLNWKNVAEYSKYYNYSYEERFKHPVPNGEGLRDVKRRVGDFLYEIDSKYSDKNILIVSHETPLWMAMAIVKGADVAETITLRKGKDDVIIMGEIIPIEFSQIPYDEDYVLDFHRPYIDAITWLCSCGGKMARVKEVMDVWFDSGAMPFAQDHYPFQNRELVEGAGYPADFISEAIDQTRGWFYTLHAVGILMKKGKAYKNVICLGHLEKDGKKMSKSVGNVVDPWEQSDKFGVDALRFWMYSVNQPGDSKNYDEKTVDEIVKKVFNLLSNIGSFYAMYKEETLHDSVDPYKSTHVLDQWLLAWKDKLVSEVTKELDAYNLFDPTRAIRDFIADFSQWYIRRSRDRFKGDDETDKKYALATTRGALLDLAKIMAPFTPFFAEDLYKRVGGGMESVHLENWPKVKEPTLIEKVFTSQKNQNEKLIEEMAEVRRIVSLALEARAKAGIKVRQPLLKLTVKQKISDKLLPLILEEVNVKEVSFNPKIAEELTLDLTLTPELENEGRVREFIRAVQELRKKEKFNPHDRIVIEIGALASGRSFIEKFQNFILKGISADSIVFTSLSQDQITINGLSFSIRLKKASPKAHETLEANKL